MQRALDRWAAQLVLGAGGALAAVCALFSSGSSSGRLAWIGVAALCVAAAVGAAALAGVPPPGVRAGGPVAPRGPPAVVAREGVSLGPAVGGGPPWGCV